MQVNAEERLADHANSGKTELIPNVFWFSKSTVAGVTDSFRAQYNFPYMNWTEVPQTVRDRWFLEFKRNFTWKPEYDDMVRRDYEKKGVERLKDHVNKARKKVPLHKPVSWMSDTVHAEFVRKREDPDFIKRSTKAKKNRYSSQSEKSFDLGHRQGSISIVEVAEHLNKGVSKAPDDVFLEVVGGVKKGKVYGFGNASSMFYEAGNSSQTKQ